MSPDRRELVQVVVSRSLVAVGAALLIFVGVLLPFYLSDRFDVCREIDATIAGEVEISSTRLTILPPGIECTASVADAPPRVIGVAGTGTILALLALPLGLIVAGATVKTVSVIQRELLWRSPLSERA